MSSSAGEPIDELDVVALTRSLPDEGLPPGQTGTVVLVHDDGGAYEVEFILHARRSVVATVPRESLLKLKGYGVASMAS